jgi:hypothetical protein
VDHDGTPAGDGNVAPGKSAAAAPKSAGDPSCRRKWMDV